MPTVQIDPSLAMFYEDTCFADPWQTHETAVLIHGIAESSRAWFGWLPHLSRHLRVLALDLRGFGGSTAPPPEFRWSLDIFVSDLKRFLDRLKIGAAHIVGAKFGGSVAFQFAAEYPEQTRTLTVVSGPVKVRETGGSMDLLSIAGRIREVGLRRWAAETQRSRLGSEVPEEQIAWWNDLMAQSNPQVCIGVTGSLGQLSVFDNLGRIKAPTLIMTTEGSRLQSVETVRETQKQIANSEILILPGDSYHIAAARPDECARHFLQFIRKHGSKVGSIG
jgi:pimeloyl-ACP methyl ester carboxylesterase